MESLRCELSKLKRSLSWTVVVLFPVVTVLLGAMGAIATKGELEDGWHTLWLQSVGFYGMALLPVGVAILASLVWRVEHKNSNWNALMSGPTSTLRVVLGKVFAVAILSAAMQAVLLITVIVLGTVILGLPGMLPATYFVSSVVIMLACIPLAALQSALSTFFRSFPIPVAIALVGTGISTMALLINLTAATAVPYALATHATQIGTLLAGSDAATSFDAPPMSASSVSFVAAMAVTLTVVVVAGTTAILNRRDTRA